MAKKETPKELATKKKKSSTTSSKSKVTVSKKQTQKITKEVSKISKKSGGVFIVPVVLLVLGFIGGYLGFNYVTQDDMFVMNDYVYVEPMKNLENETAKDLYSEVSNETAVLFVGEQYKEYGTTCVSFGKDITSDVSLVYYYREDISHDYVSTQEVDTSKSGYYYAVYQVDNLRYSGVQLIRNIIVLEVENNG